MCICVQIVGDVQIYSSPASVLPMLMCVCVCVCVCVYVSEYMLNLSQHWCLLAVFAQAIMRLLTSVHVYVCVLNCVSFCCLCVYILTNAISLQQI